MSSLIGHYERHFGTIQHGWSRSADRAEMPFQVVECRGGALQGISAFATVGMSRYELKSATSAKLIRAGARACREGRAACATVWPRAGMPPYPLMAGNASMSAWRHAAKQCRGARNPGAARSSGAEPRHLARSATPFHCPEKPAENRGARVRARAHCGLRGDLSVPAFGAWGADCRVWSWVRLRRGASVPHRSRDSPIASRGV
jgi:hypothetical protein